MYGILIASVSAGCLLLIEKIIKQSKVIPLNDFWLLSVILIPSSIVGGRIYHILDYWDYYSKYPIEIINIKNGGLGIFGALITSTAIVYVFARVKEQKSLIYLDLFILFTPLVQIAGRLGNYFNKELFGLPTNAPWGIFIPKSLRPQQYVEYKSFHPLFLYEIIFLLVLFSFLADMYVNKKIKLGEGKITAIYLIGYGTIRLVLEPLRIGNAWVLGGINLTYLFSIVLIVIGLLLRIKNYRK